MLLKSNAFYILSIVIMVASGCANAPFEVDPAKDIYQSQLAEKKIPIKAGIYLSNDLKQYIYKQQKMGIPFQMRVGEYLSPITMTMGSAIFNDVKLVNSLPPYNDNYKPDIEAVIKPEIIFCYGNAAGAFSGYIEAKLKLRITIYDLAGNILWQDEAIGESTSNDIGFISSLLTSKKEVDKVGYQAASFAATNIINDFYAKPPQEIFSVLEINKAESLRNRGTLLDFELFKKLYEMGRSQYNNKNYYQALYYFVKASNINPDEPAALFYTGASYTYIGEKDRALKKFADVINKKALEAGDAKRWIQRLNDPLKIGITSDNKYNSSAINNTVIKDALINSGMYKVINIAGLASPNNPITSSSNFSQFLNKCYKKGVKVVILYDVSSSSQKAQSNQYSGEDVATDHRVIISAKVYSTKKKQLKTEIQINERSSIIQEQAMEEEKRTRQQLLQIGAKKLVLQLLKNDIF